MELKDIKAVVDLVVKNRLSEFDLEQEGFKIRIKREGEGHATVVSPVLVSHAAPQAVVAPAAAASAPAPTPADNTRDILSPMVGTFYRSPSPDSPSYVEIGQSVKEDTVLCIIEAMKVMNEIKAEARGVITEVVAENGKPVDFGKPLFKIRPQ